MTALLGRSQTWCPLSPELHREYSDILEAKRPVKLVRGLAVTPKAHNG